MTVVLFLPTGKTFTFRDARITVDNENMLVIVYKAMSDGLLKQITVQKSAIVGHGIDQ